jgi:NhaP-type Na+/H+ or K+/H+ antiporter
MKLQSALLPLLIGLFAYTLFCLIRLFFPGFSTQSIPFLPTAMYLAVAAGLYLNVSDIDIRELLKNKVAIASVLILGIPAKIFLPGLLLLAFMPVLGKAAVFLCATVIAQIDPILAAKNIAHERFSPKSGAILRCWASFDDPITVLFAFYIFLPLLLKEQSSLLSQYFVEISLELLACAGLTILFQSQRQMPIMAQRKIRQVMVIAICIASGLLGRFLLPASLGLMARPFSAESKERVLNWIFGFSAFVVGALAVDISLNWPAGILLGAATFFIAQPLVALLFIRDSKENLLRVMAGHQNGMTAILLTIALDLQIGNAQLLAITLPAIIAIAVFYAVVNYWLDQNYALPAMLLDENKSWDNSSKRK